MGSPYMSNVVEPIEDSEDIDKVKYDKFKRKDSSYGEKGNDKDCCYKCGITGSCLRCSCVMNGHSCSSCVPSKHGKCKNKSDRCMIKSGLTSSGLTSVVTVADHLSHGDGSLQDSLPSGNGEGNDGVGDSLGENSRMVRVFGANVLN